MGPASLQTGHFSLAAIMARATADDLVGAAHVACDHHYRTTCNTSLFRCRDRAQVRQGDVRQGDVRQGGVCYRVKIVGVFFPGIRALRCTEHAI